MPFRDTQLGRFGELCSSHFSTHGDPDMKAAHALAANGAAIPPRPLLQAVLGTKLLLEDTDVDWQTWMGQLSSLLNNYQAAGGGPLAGECTRSWPSQPQGFCMHELTPPLRFWTMRSFCSRMRVNNLLRRADGTVGVDTSVQPLWNYVVTSRGEILVAAEDFGWIKHTSIAGGQNVWAAGQVGLDNGKLHCMSSEHFGHLVWR